MTEVRLKPKLTECTFPLGQFVRPGRPGITRHSLMIKELGTCRMCGSTRLYAGSREEMLEELSDAFLKIYVNRDENNAEQIWGVEDTFFAEVMNLEEEELPPSLEKADDLHEVDYDTEGLRIIREGLMRAAGKIEAHLNAAGEDL